MLQRLAEGPGIVGVDGAAYPAPTLDQVLELLERSEELVETKAEQGFTRLQLTPVATPVQQLIEGVNAAVRAREGGLLRTKRDPGDADVPAGVSSKEPVWIWERVRAALDTPEVVYFPAAYTGDHGGQAKEEVVRDPRRCSVPGWSVGLIEPISIMPGEGRGRVVGGRRQLEAGSTPRDYLGTLATPPYRGETGWTLEDLLTHFLVHLEATGQVSHDRADGNATWLLGTYLPTLVPGALVVPTASWQSGWGRRLYLGAHRTGNRLDACGARTMVRL